MWNKLVNWICIQVLVKVRIGHLCFAHRFLGQNLLILRNMQMALNMQSICTMMSSRMSYTITNNLHFNESVDAKHTPSMSKLSIFPRNCKGEFSNLEMYPIKLKYEIFICSIVNGISLNIKLSRYRHTLISVQTYNHPLKYVQIEWIIQVL